jgi:hypothetical protein
MPQLQPEPVRLLEGTPQMPDWGTPSTYVSAAPRPRPRRGAPPFPVAPAAPPRPGPVSLLVAGCAALVFRSGLRAPLSQRTIVGAEGLEPPACSKDVPAPGHG